MRARAHVEERQQHLGAGCRARAAARRRCGRACPGRRRSPPAAPRSPAGARQPHQRMPRAIAPLVTTTTSHAGGVQRRDLVADRAPPRPAAARRCPRRRCYEPSLTTATRHGSAPTRDPARTRRRRSRRRRPARSPAALQRARARPSAAAAARRGPAPPRSRGRSAASSRSTGSPLTTQRAVPAALDLEAAVRGGPEDLVLRHARPRPRASGAGSAHRHAAQQLARSSSSPPGRAGRDEHRDATPLAPLRGGRLRPLRRHEVGLRQRQQPRQRGEPRVVRGQLALDRLVVVGRVGAVERREVQHVHEQPRALDVGEEVVAEPRALAARPRSARGCRR